VTINAAVFFIEHLINTYNELCELLLAVDADQSPAISAGTMQITKHPYRGKIIIRAWEFVDWSNKLRVLLGTKAEFGKLDWFNELTQTLSLAEDTRHYLQHFDRSIGNIITSNCSFLGSVHATIMTKEEPDTHHCPKSYHTIVIPSDYGYVDDHQTEVGQVAFPTQPSGDIDGVGFSIDSCYVNITLIANSLLSVKESLSVHLKKKYNFIWNDEIPSL